MEVDKMSIDEGVSQLIEFQSTLVAFLWELKGLKNPEVDNLFTKYQVELRERE